MPIFLLITFFIKIFLANVVQFQDIRVLLEAVLLAITVKRNWCHFGMRSRVVILLWYAISLNRCKYTNINDDDVMARLAFYLIYSSTHPKPNLT